MNKKQKEQQETIEYLRGILKPGDTIYCNLRYVSRSGMYRVIDLIVFKDDSPVYISWLAARLLEGYDEKHGGCKVSGCGMDMGLHLVEGLGYYLFPDGYDCVGAKCPSNDHFNPPYPERSSLIETRMHHKSGGYAFHHKWL